MKRDVVWSYAVATLALSAGALVLMGASSPVRATVVFIFLLLGPGMAFVSFLDIESPWTELTLGVAASLAFDTLVATIMVETALWSASGGVLAVAVLVLAAMAARSLVRPQARRADVPS